MSTVMPKDEAVQRRKQIVLGPAKHVDAVQPRRGTVAENRCRRHEERRRLSAQKYRVGTAGVDVDATDNPADRTISHQPAHAMRCESRRVGHREREGTVEQVWRIHRGMRMPRIRPSPRPLSTGLIAIDSTPARESRTQQAGTPHSTGGKPALNGQEPGTQRAGTRHSTGRNPALNEEGQRKTTVLVSLSMTRVSECQRTARDRTELSTSRPAATSCSAVKL
jgi:hypothetical protein